MYTDYEFYALTYGGTAISESEFAALENKAAMHIDMLTANRLKSGWAVTDEVESAVCAVMEVLKSTSAYETIRPYDSENNDGYSVNYNKDLKASIANGIRDAATPYLAFTGLLYRGGIAW